MAYECTVLMAMDIIAILGGKGATIWGYPQHTTCLPCLVFTRKKWDLWLTCSGMNETKRDTLVSSDTLHQYHRDVGLSFIIYDKTPYWVTIIVETIMSSLDVQCNESFLFTESFVLIA